MSNYIERYWRDATPQDAIKEPPMMARFRNGEGYTWHNDYLMGIRRDSNYPWYSPSLGNHKQCQVLDIPDPGDGWRLIDPITEALQEGDEFMLFFDRKRGWIYIDTEVTNWSEKNFYRRRIEQPKPEPRYEPFRWEDRDELRGRLITFVDRNRTVEFRCESFAVDDDGLIVNDAYADWLCKNAVFVDTKEPVGRRVQ